MLSLRSAFYAVASAVLAATTLNAGAIAQEYAFPFWGDDLPPGVRITTSNHAPGIQRLGEDIGAMRYLGNGKWSKFKSNASPNKDKNSDFVIYGMPFYAIADGEVIGCWRLAPENPGPGKTHSARQGEDKFIIGGGNHLWVRQDDGAITLYAHAIPGSIPRKLCPKDRELTARPAGPFSGHPDVDPQAFVPEGVAPDVPTGGQVRRPRVRRGQLLGRVGNSGASSAGHLHIHSEFMNGNQSEAHELRFERGLWSPRNGTSGDINDWRSFAGKKIPDGPVFIWPARRLADEYARHRFNPADYGRLFKHLDDSGYSPTWFDGYSVAGKVFYNFVWRPKKRAYRAWRGLTGTKYQDHMDDAIRDGFAPVHVESYLSKGRLRYALIVEKGAPGSFLAKHGLTLDQHRQWLDTAKARGLKPVNVSVVSVNNKRSYTVLYRSDSIGAWEVHSRVPIDKYQAVFDKQDRAGKRPSYLAAYMHGGKPHISAVFASSYKTAVTRHGLSPKAYQSEWASNTKADRLTRVVSAHDGAKRKHLFVGVWKSGAP